MALAGMVVLALGLLVQFFWNGARDGAVPAPPPDNTGLARTGSDGRPPGLVSAPTHADPAVGDPPRLPPPVDLDSVDPAHDVHGVVVDRDGTPIAGASVRIRERVGSRALVRVDPEESPPDVAATTTASDGTFAIRLEAGRSVEIEAAKDGFAPRILEGVSPGARLRLVLGRGVEVSVRVFSPAGRPAPDVSVALLALDMRFGSLAGELEGVTDASGQILFEGVPAGLAAHLRATARDPSWGSPPPSRVSLPDEGRVEADIHLLPALTLTGVVVRADSGEAIAGARIGHGLRLMGAVVSDEQGAFELGGWTRQGSAQVHVVAPGFAREIVVVGAETDLRIAMRRGSAIRGRIVDADGGGLRGAELMAVASKHVGHQQHLSVGRALGRDDGTFQVDDLDPEQPHRLHVRVLGYATALVDSDPTPAGEVRDLGDIVLSSPEVLEGHVLTEDDQPVVGAAVRVESSTAGLSVRRADGQPIALPYTGERRLWTDATGRFRVDDLAPGEWTVSLQVLGSPRQAHTVRVPPRGGSEPLVLRVSTAETRVVDVTVVDETGRPVTGARVHAVGVARLVWTDASGRARVEVPAQGVVRLEALTGEDEIALRQGGSTTLRQDAESARIQLRRPLLVQGTLRDEAGRAIREAGVSASRDGANLGGDLTDARGEFHIAVETADEVEVRWGGSYGIGVHRAADEPILQPVSGLARPGVPIELVTRPVDMNGSLLLTVVDGEGRPLDAHVLLHGPQEWARREHVPGGGTTRLEGLPETELDLTVVAVAPLAQPWLAPRRTKVTPEGQSVQLTFRRGAWLEVDVVTPDGRPAARRRCHLQVTLPGETHSAWNEAQVTDDQGRIRVIVDPSWGEALRLYVYGRHPNQAPTMRIVDAAAGHTTITLE